MSTLYINGRPALINGLRKLINSPSWLVIFLVVPFNKISLFSIDIINFIKSFILLFVRVIHKPIIDEILFLIFLPIILSAASTRISLFNCLVPVLFNYFLTIIFAIIVISLIGVIGEPGSPNCTLLDNWAF